ncbi:MAG: serine hydrolase domain-containing protein [Vulcanimicrobiaceae bacterium]
MSELARAADQILNAVCARPNGVPGAVAAATDRKGKIYEGAAGKRDLSRNDAMTPDTVVCIFSCTKGLVALAAMQLVDEGKLSLDDPAENYLPELANPSVLEGFDANGEPRLRKARGTMTVGHLLLHTAGFGYEFFNHDDLRYRTEKTIPSVVTSTRASMATPLLFDPGTQWEYGINLDWTGRVVEAVRGKRLGAVMRERIFEPLEMHDTTFELTPALRARRASIHQREADGSLHPLSDFELPASPEQEMGGHGLYSTASDYLKFIAMLLNDGAGPSGPVVSAATARKMGQNGLGALKIKALPAATPRLTNPAEFFPGMPKSWGYSFMINDERAPTGRSAGALGWAGLANLFYWIDRERGLGGFYGSQIFPFADAVSFPAYIAFEKAVYDYAS